MANLSRNFTGGKMNKVVDERLVPNGEYIDALNIRMGSTEKSEIGVIENAKGNVQLSTLLYVDGTPLSTDAKCIGAVADSVNEKVYWFVHDPSFTVGATGKLDMIVSYNMNANILTYHIISVDDGGGVNTTLNFSEQFLITGVNKIDDLIFFTDDYNEPRFINVNRTYLPPVADIDQFSAESILVIKKPPIESPSINPIEVAGDENFLEENFICFAYRYRYADGEYSATSQWSAPSFVPKAFAFERDSFLNSGMINSTNGCEITYNTGSDLVVGVDLLFKSADSNVIKVIQKLDKSELGLSDNTNYTYVFSNSKIYTILPDSEILRLYDNVPRYAKAQTLMGNRLMYGNYIEGYDMIDQNGQPVKLEYIPSLVTEEIGTDILDTTETTSTYGVDGAITVADSRLDIDFTDAINGSGLIAGAYISIDVTLEHESFSTTPYPSGTTSAFTISFFYQLPSDYASLAALVADNNFQVAIGTPSNIQPVSNAGNGITFTDIFNDAIPSTLALSPSGYYNKYRSGITALDQPIYVSVSGNTMRLQFPAMQFVDNLTTPTLYSFEYYKVSAASATYQPIGTAKSLHSNRDYDIGIVYMDDFNRSTTALVSQNNTVFVPCQNSSLKNSIQVNIPVTQIAPSWATRYKFVIKPNAEGYETIYSNIFYTEAGTNYVWFLLEGENAKKVEVGDRYIVKADSNGPMQTCAYATVLDKDIKTPSGGYPNGVYMKMLPTEFSAVLPPNAVYTVSDSQQKSHSGGPFPQIELNILNQPIPSGTKISLHFYWRRTGRSDSASCEQRSQEYNADFISSADYPDFKAWWEGENVDDTLNNDAFRYCYNPSACSFNNYNSAFITGAYLGPYSLVTNYFQFEQTGGNPFKLWVTGTEACTGGSSPRRDSYLEGSITIVRAINTIIFETLPVDSNPDIYYENDLSFSINANGEHQGNVQNQVFSTATPAIVDTGFFNCFAFGNGAESYKVRDSIIGHSFNLGNRVTSVSAQDYKEADRYADITYSGIYNSESNVNKLNEFNLGLLNYKPLESSFGGIYILDGRETDVLVLQEDKISYVLAGKNLLSDAAAGGAITSVPEVLGTQIARVEKYGITFNPESYVQWGYDRFFTDSKRGAVIQLKGNSYSNEQLKVVSEQGMRTWFRDEFIDRFYTQKLGGFDPYMNEYVLSSNDITVGGVDSDGCVNCGQSQTFVLSGQEESNVLDYCIDLGSTVGLSTLTWTVLSASTGPSDGFQISITYNGVTTSSSFTSTSGLLSFAKDDITINTADITVSMTGQFTLGLSMSCPLQQEMTIIEVVLTNDAESGQTTFAQYRYSSGAFTAPLQSRFVTFASGTSNPLVSWYNSVSGVVGTGGFPPAGSNMRMYNNKIAPTATWDFNILEDKFKYYRSNVAYGNNSTDLNNLLALASNAVPISGTSPIYYADFTVPPTGTYLYLIWDYRLATSNLLCYGVDSTSTCCDCESCDANSCVTVEVTNNSEQYYAAVTFNGGLCDEGIPFSLELEPAETASICVINSSPLYSVSLGNPTVTVANCQCAVTPCYYYFVINSCNEPQVSSTTFAGWTIDGADFLTNYQSILSGYGVNASNMANLGYNNILLTSQGVVVWFKGLTPPPLYVGYITDSLGNPINYTWSVAECDSACWKLDYNTGFAPSNNVAYLDGVGVQISNVYSISSQVDCVATFGSYLDASSPSSMATLQTYLRSMYGNQVDVYSLSNGSGNYDIYVNNVYDFGGWFFLSDRTGLLTNAYWNGLIEPCGEPPICEPNPLNFSGIYHNWTGLVSYDWTYVTQQITGTTYPIDILIQVSAGPYCSASAPNDVFLYYRRDTIPPPYGITTTNTDPATQGFTQITFTSGGSTVVTLPAVAPNEYLTFAVISLASALCSSSATTFDVLLRNASPECLGQVITTFTAKSCINLSGLAPCP
jgi:hypothetical protein